MPGLPTLGGRRPPPPPPTSPAAAAAAAAAVAWPWRCRQGCPTQRQGPGTSPEPPPTRQVPATPLSRKPIYLSRINLSEGRNYSGGAGQVMYIKPTCASFNAASALFISCFFLLLEGEARANVRGRPSGACLAVCRRIPHTEDPLLSLQCDSSSSDFGRTPKRPTSVTLELLDCSHHRISFHFYYFLSDPPPK